ncbi:MAG: carbon starvation CstA family protein, partial [Planctomycetota bacterium]
ESVLSVWTAMPVAAAIGWMAISRGRDLVLPCLLGLVVLYATIYLGSTIAPIDLAKVLPEQAVYATPVVVWSVLLLAYAFVASVLPVWLLLQPRDFINSLQLAIAVAMLLIGLAVASLSGAADLSSSAPAIASAVPADAPPMFPFLFITIACGACSGFHCLVSSGTTSKQLRSAGDAQMVGYGSMLGEGMLAVLVVLACCAGVGMGKLTRTQTEQGTLITREDVSLDDVSGEGSPAWRAYYRTGLPASGSAVSISKIAESDQSVDDNPLADEAVAVDDSSSAGGWKQQGLDKKLAAFIDGGANFMSTIGMPLKFGVAIMAVMVACFAATTLDTATRLQRYVLAELAGTIGWKFGTNKFVATGIAVGVGLAIAIFAGDAPGKGGLMLWPLFGATNQLLAGLALMVATFYLARRNRPLAVVAVPMMLMMLMPAWAMTFDLTQNWWPNRDWVLVIFGLGTLAIQGWMVAEACVLWRRMPRDGQTPSDLSENDSSGLHQEDDSVAMTA